MVKGGGILLCFLAWLILVSLNVCTHSIDHIICSLAHPFFSGISLCMLILGIFILWNER